MNQNVISVLISLGLLLSLSLPAPAQEKDEIVEPDPEESPERHRDTGGDDEPPPPAESSPEFTEFFPWYEVNNTIQVLGADGVTLVPVDSPFLHGIATDIPSHIQDDFLPEDGWELVYNYLSTDVIRAVPFFAIYNKFNGILRFFYIFNRDDSWTHMSFGLQVGRSGGSSSLLNMIGDFAQADDVKPSKPWIVHMNEKTFGASGPALYHWHYFEVEVAYDDRIKDSTFRDLDMLWFGRGSDVFDISLSGQQIGTLEGAIRLSGSSVPPIQLRDIIFEQSNISRTEDSSSDVNVQVTSGPPGGRSFEDRILEKLDLQAFGNIANQITELLEIPSKLADGVLDFLGSPFTSVLKSFLGGGGGSGGGGTISARLDTRIELDGTMTINQRIFDQTLMVPGTSFDPTDNVIVPHYNQPLGTFNIKNTPTLILKESFSNPIGLGSLGTVGQSYILTEESKELLVNPAIADLIQVMSVEPRILYYTSYAGPSRIGTFSNITPVERPGHVLIDSDPDFTLYFGGNTTLSFRFTGRAPTGNCLGRVKGGIVVQYIVHYRRNDTGDDLMWMQTYLPKFRCAG